MKKILILILVFISFELYSKNPCYNSENIKSFRKETNFEYKTSEKSPLTAEDKKKFKSLSFFRENEKFAVIAKFLKNSVKDTIMIKTSKSDIRKMSRFGTFTFRINKKEYKLTAFVKADELNPKSLFVPFTDLTTRNGKSYSAGRYLDIEYQSGKTDYCIDFNLAYNPYCAYNKKYSCPLVPFENQLEIEILAGEKKFKK
jgi:uncharacterized protein (DUF1684 family)